MITKSPLTSLFLSSPILRVFLLPGAISQRVAPGKSSTETIDTLLPGYQGQRISSLGLARLYGNRGRQSKIKIIDRMTNMKTTKPDVHNLLISHRASHNTYIYLMCNDY